MTNSTQTMYIEAYAELACKLVSSGNGRDEPKALDIEDAHISCVHMLGTLYTRKGLIEWLGEYGAEKFMEKILDEAPTDEWETE
ncbi:MAG: hypothetical protein JKY32_07200 [Rhizobiales bacterium]|nr:hypothetical protein [Hyphomicrobiales bacterium]